MRRSLVLLLLFLVSGWVNAQILDPVSWSISAKKIQGNEYEISMEALIDGKWHIYSQQEFEDTDLAPIPTEFTFNTTEDTYKLLGETQEPKVAPLFDEVFELEVIYFESQALFTQRIELINPELKSIALEILYVACDDRQCLAPELKSFEVDLVSGSGAVDEGGELSERDIRMSEELVIPLEGEINPEEEEKGYLTIFLLGFVGGLLALFTPCVFPMIPLTVSFFTKGAENRKRGLRNAILYGFFIFLIYVLLSLPFHLLDTVDEGLLNNISTNVWLNLLFFVMFLVFAFSFFGYFELTLPSSWSSKMDQKANSIGGVIGIFFMALTLAIVSFSCTGPILGGLLGSSLSQDAGAMQLSFGMGGFGLALALPFALFAMFPNWLNSLPKSGGWLNSVKVVLGFIELALAFKFFSNADLVMHWGLLKREIFIAIWILCALGVTLYLFGFIRFPHDGPKKRPLPIGNWVVGLLFLIFAGYMVPGLTNTKMANLKLLSGLAPPMFYSIYDKGTSAPLGLKAYKDFYAGIEAAKNEGKPIMLDFTGWACVNCRKMEEHVWSEPEIFKVINEDYILISLYVDDRKDLPEEAQFSFKKPQGGVKKVQTIGDKWTAFQTVNFKNNSQPYYVLLTSDFELLNAPTAYTPDPEEYLAWLQQGLSTFRK